MVTYYELGGQKRLSDIVFAGSHDASITQGSSNAQTQNLNIADQADAGVRLFDLRILAQRVGDGASLVGYHGSAGSKKAMTVHSSHTNTSFDIVASKKMTAGTFGMKLSNMLAEAKTFVENTNEFLIFKFDKCTNYQIIAEYCTSILKGAIYKSNGMELGKCTLDDLKHKVICVFKDSARSQIQGLGESDGILGFRTLNDKNDPMRYVANYPGLQYYGKGGTNAVAGWKTKRQKRAENVSKQEKLMLQMANSTIPQAPDVLGMMYWTATGMVHSIKERNKVLWNTTGVRQMKELWEESLGTAIDTQLRLDTIKCMEYGGVRRIKAFFPNIIMIDFADTAKCTTIRGLNTVAENKLIAAYDDLIGA